MKRFSMAALAVCVALPLLSAAPTSAQQAPIPSGRVCDYLYVPQCTVQSNGDYHCVYVLVEVNCRDQEVTINP